MGILHSTRRLFWCKTEDDVEEGEWPIYPYSSERFPNVSRSCSSIHNAILEGFRFLFGFVWRRKRENHFLPIQNTSSREPLLVQTRGSDKGRSQSSYQPEKKQRDRDDILGITRATPPTVSERKDATRNVPTSSSTVSVRKDTPRNVPTKKADREEEKEVIYKPSSTVSVRKDGPRNVPTKKADREEEKKVSCKELTSSSTVSVGKDAPRYVLILGTKKAGREEEEKKVSCKELTSSSTVSVRKDAPRNVPMKKTDREEEEKKKSCKELTSSSTVSVRKDAPRNVIVGMKKADREEEKKVSCKVQTSSSTVSVAPRNVPFLEERMWKKQTDPEEEKKKKKKVCLIMSITIEERWIQHYSSRHRILLVGEGDFSFSASLAVAFSSASNIIATSLNSQEFLLKNYFRAASNIEKLRSRESKVMHEIDAMKMANHPSLRHLKFDRIIFNFPYAGLDLKTLPRDSQLRRHRRLVSQFLKNAREMISEDGEIHISHKTNHFHTDFKLESIASSHNLRLIEAVDFNNKEYPGYNTKCGFGGNNNFNCNPSKTYKFGIKNFHHY